MTTPNDIIYKWARYLEINFYHAGADYDCLSAAMGEDNTTEYMIRKMAGDTISLDEYAKNKGLFITWSLYI